MHSADRDQTHVVKAEQECRQMLMQYPDSRHADATRQMLREVQEVLADGEFRVGAFYSFRAATAPARIACRLWLTTIRCLAAATKRYGRSPIRT